MIVTRLRGGLGNQLFQFAAGKALALRHNVPLTLDPTPLLDRTPRRNFTFRTLELRSFGITAELANPRDLPRLYRYDRVRYLGPLLDRVRRRVLRRAGIERTPFYDPQFPELPANTCLDGYWQSFRYFSDQSAAIRRELSIDAAGAGRLAGLIASLQGRRPVCVHVRRTDFLNNPLYRILDPVYYRQALDVISAKVAGGVQPVIFTDDAAWCELHLKQFRPAAIVGPAFDDSPPALVLKAMSLCEHFIIANSTFSWWAAWLSPHRRKLVVAPRSWHTTPGWHTDDLLPPEWFAI